MASSRTAPEEMESNETQGETPAAGGNPSSRANANIEFRFPEDMSPRGNGPGESGDVVTVQGGGTVSTTNPNSSDSGDNDVDSEDSGDALNRDPTAGQPGFDVGEAAIRNLATFHDPRLVELTRAQTPEVIHVGSDVSGSQSQVPVPFPGARVPSKQSGACVKSQYSTGSGESQYLSQTPPKFGRRLSMTTQRATERFSYEQWQEFGVDCWSEGSCGYTLLLLTSILEFLPPWVAFFISWPIETWEAACNRFLGNNRTLARMGGLIFLEAFLAPTFFWITLIWYFADDSARDEEDDVNGESSVNSGGPRIYRNVFWLDLISFGLLKLYRAFCLGMKYAYFSESEIACLRGTDAYGEFGKVLAALGSSCFYDAQGMLEWILMEKLLESALRNDLLEEFQRGTFKPRMKEEIGNAEANGNSLNSNTNGSYSSRIPSNSAHAPTTPSGDPSILRGAVAVAQTSLRCFKTKQIFDQMKKDAQFKLPYEHVCRSKYGDVRDILGLHRINQINLNVAKSASKTSVTSSGGLRARRQAGGANENTNTSANGSANNHTHNTSTTSENNHAGGTENDNPPPLTNSPSVASNIPNSDPNNEPFEVPLPLFAYSLVCTAFARTPPPSRRLMPVALLGAFIVPAGRAIQNYRAMNDGNAEDQHDSYYPFGDSSSAQAIYGIRVWHMMIGFMMCVGFMKYPFEDVYRKWKLSNMLLILFNNSSEAKAALREHGEFECLKKCAQINPKNILLVDGYNPDDLNSFWIIYKILSPTFFYGYMTRYNNGYTLVNLGYLCMATVVVIAHISQTTGTTAPTTNSDNASAGSSSQTSAPTSPSDSQSTATSVYWPFVAELGFIFVISAFSLIQTIVYGVRYNRNVAKLPNILSRATLRAGIERARRREEMAARDASAADASDGTSATERNESRIDANATRLKKESDWKDERLNEFLALAPEVNADMQAHAQQHPAQ